MTGQDVPAPFDRCKSCGATRASHGPRGAALAAGCGWFVEPDPVSPKPKARRGFAGMAPEKQRAIASSGGKASHAPGGRGHEWTREQAAIAGRKGGSVSRGGRGKVPT